MKRLKLNRNWRSSYFNRLRARYYRYISNYREYLYFLVYPYGYVD